MQADVLITIVSDPPALEEVLWGASGALEGLRRGSLSSIPARCLRIWRAARGRSCAERGVEFLDAPVTGGTWGAEKGELVFMIGGKAEVLERAQAGLEAMGKKFFLLGPNGAGQTVKLAMNLILALQVDALAEALALVTAAGVAGERLVEVLQSSMGRPALLDIKAPLMLKHEYPASFPLRLMQKDLRLALELARENKASRCRRPRRPMGHYTTVKDSSNDDPDYAAVARFWEPKRN